jgi:hypothetical protein
MMGTVPQREWLLQADVDNSAATLFAAAKTDTPLTHRGTRRPTSGEQMA